MFRTSRTIHLRTRSCSNQPTCGLEVRRVKRPERDDFANEIRRLMQAIHANIRPILEDLPDATKESIGLMKVTASASRISQFLS